MRTLSLSVPGEVRSRSLYASTSRNREIYTVTVWQLLVMSFLVATPVSLGQLMLFHLINWKQLTTVAILYNNHEWLYSVALRVVACLHTFGIIFVTCDRGKKSTTKLKTTLKQANIFESQNYMALHSVNNNKATQNASCEIKWDFF